jgi:C4-dicarboxylate transporter DctM subunit
MFVGGIVPGILLAAVLMGLNAYASRRGAYGEIHRFEGVKPVLRGSLRTLPALTVPMLLLSGIVFGVFTPTEAGAVTVFYALLLGAIYFRTITFAKVAESLRATTRVTASVLLIVATALVFNRIMTFFRVPEALLNTLLEVTSDPILLTLLIVAFLLVVGTFMDELSNMLILGPLLMPICTSAEGIGMHPIQYGLFLMTAILLGLLTPPLSLLLNVVAPIGRVSIERVSLAVLPFFFAEVGVLLVMAFVPAVTMTLPRLFGFA